MISIRWRRSAGAVLRLSGCYRVTGSVTLTVTAKPLLLHGFQGLLPVTGENGILDAYARVHTRALYSLSLLGNMVTNRYFVSISMGWPLLPTLPGASCGGNSVTLPRLGLGIARCSNKIGGGYGRGGRRGADLQARAGGARQKFRAIGASSAAAGGRARPAAADQGAIEASAWSAGTDPRNGGFPPLAGGRSGAVGTIMLERSSQATDLAALFGVRPLLGQQTRRRGLAEQLAGQGTPGADRHRPPAPPPIARVRSPGPWRSMLAGFGSTVAPDCLDGSVGRLNSFAQMGWGVSELASCLEGGERLAGCPGADRGGLGDDEPSSEPLAPGCGDPLTLWGGRDHVNAR